jgi:hypothetical protein
LNIKEYVLGKIAIGIENAYGITLKEIQQKKKERNIMLFRKLFSLVAKQFGYKGSEISSYIWKDPVIVTRYLRENEKLRSPISSK